MKYANLLFAALAAPAQAAFTWKNVKTGGGGGFVPSIVFHPATKGVAYARTDIGGLYRLNAADDSWTAVTDANGFADDSHWSRWGVDALALDPQDDKKVFAAVGTYTNSWDPYNGQIARSSDRGATWSFADLPFKVGGNMPGRGNGERLAVDPKNSSIIYFGARSGNGLWKSADGGASFSKVSSFTAVGTFRAGPAGDEYNGDIQGLNFVTFDPTSAAVGGATSRIFVGVAENATSSLYVSNDAGSTWSAVAGQPGRYFPHKGRIQPAEKALYVSYADGTGPYDGTSGSVWRYDIAAGAWKDITPVSGADLYHGFGGLSVDLQKPGTLIVASLNSWWPDAKLFRSTDSGNTWKQLWTWGTDGNQNFSYVQTSPKAPWIKTNFLDVDTKDLGWMIESFEIDPTDSDHWLWGTGLTIFGGHDLTNWDAGAKVNIQSLADGIEEMAIQDLASAPGGPELLVATGDNNGFTYEARSDIDSAPRTTWTDPMWATSVGVDYAGNKVASVVRVGNTVGTPQLAVSSDGGATWAASPAAGTAQYGGSVAYSADGDVILWSTATAGVQRSADAGPLAAVSGIPAGAVIASDKRNGTVFYGASGSRFYRSADGGATFSAAGGSLGSATGVRHIEAHPAKAGDVWVSTDAGIFHSADYGSSFARASAALANVHQVSLGRGPGAAWNLYAFGTGPAGRRLYGSADLGASWTDLQGSQSFGAVDSAKIAGSGNEENLVYVGTNGRGVFYASGVIPSSGGGGASTSTAPTSTAGPSVSSPAATVSSSSSAVGATSVSTSSTSAVRTSTSSAPAPTATNRANQYEQCGGAAWNGPTQCVPPYTCKLWNEWYSQCV